MQAKFSCHQMWIDPNEMWSETKGATDLELPAGFDQHIFAPHGVLGCPAGT